MKKIIYGIPAVILAMPALAFAQLTTNPNQGIQGIFTLIQTVLRYLVPIVISVAVLYFLFGVLKYIGSGGDPEKQKEARNVMIYGIIGIFVMVSVWGLVNILQSTFGFNNNQAAPSGPQLPSINNTSY